MSCEGISQIDSGRGRYYEFLAWPLFWRGGGEQTGEWERFKTMAKELSQNPLNEGDAAAWQGLLNADFEAFVREQNALFFGLDFVGVPLTASFYDEGRDDGEKRLLVIDIFKRGGYRIDRAKMSVAEDYLGVVFELAARLLYGGKSEIESELFRWVINDFGDEFAKMLAGHSEANFFKYYAQIFSSFIEVQRAILGVKAPAFTHSVALESLNKKPHQSKMPTPKSKTMWDEFTAL